MIESELRRHRGDYGLDGSFAHLPAPAQAAGAGALLAGLAAVAAGGFARGRLRQGVGAASLAAWLVGTAAIYLHTTRRGKFAVWAELLSDLDLRGDERILDLGCGRGAVLLLAARLLPRGRAVGVDLWLPDQTGNSMDATRRNAQLEDVADRVELRTADMTELPFPDGTFDAVVSNVALHNIPTAAGRRAAIDEAARVLRPGGRLLLVDLAFTRTHAVRLRELGLQHVRRRDVGWRMWWGGPLLRTHAVTAVKGPSAP